MKGRDSGMPEEAFWTSFFDAEGAVDRLLGKNGVRGNVVEFGCGYGTFTIPAARRTTGMLSALDIEPDMVKRLRSKAEERHLINIRAQLRDFVADGTGLETASQSHAMIFNLLHLEQPVALLQEAHRILHAGGVLSVIHWRSDIPTPRGPSLEIRPTPEQCRAWMSAAGFGSITDVGLQGFCPFHYGLVATR
ncbi:Methyltransferase type 11 [Candidatus Accumulibacter aalborgensis]|uniref:Methyltransferase type 11 n=1 Tax=Candidatus Accumulibacter aalborgensis TaxID=1860102 RepID=A0A1A8XHP3_9PROT|nr:class I SAM-dependent methyltransferase [Candidatus Accumulibacter aalborgensis]SBT03458.1 Methyltransferase type 11 [Candidatus Accumulibacter aalborgensis]